MVSLPAQRVANEVLESIGKGEKPSVRKIAPRHGYALSTADSGEIQKTKSFQSIINPVVNAWIKERNRITKALSKKDLDAVSYRDGMDAIDKLTKNIQLLTGGSTENVAIAGVEISVRK